MNTDNTLNEKQGNAAGDFKDKIIFIKRDSSEWNYMWQKLAVQR